MKRLTKKIDNGRFVTTDAEARSYGETDPEDGFFYNYFTGEAVDKLAAYEDTGLEPADIEELLKENGELENSGRVLVAAFARLKEKVPHWISVEERLPEENKNYLCYGVFLPLGVKAMDMYRFDGVRWRTSSDVKITHWMPLPEPPKEVQDG